ncbi:MAG: NUDIX domain-containing protein [Parcubacteria group bacterium]
MDPQPHNQLTTTDPQDELLYSVDENDTVLGKVTRKEAHSNPNIIQRTIGVFIFNKDGKALIQKRSATKDTFPNHWGIGVGGHAEYGTSYIETAVRELKEEIGIDASPSALKEVGKILLRVPQESELWHIYRYRLGNEKLSFNSEEIQETKFVTIDELGHMLRDPNMEWKDQAKRLYDEFLKK